MAISGNPSPSLTKNHRPTSIHSSSSRGTADSRGSSSFRRAMNSTVNEETCRQMASSLVDNLLAKAIVKASQELAFTHSRDMQAQNSISGSSSRRNSQNKAANMVVTNIDINGVSIENPPEIQIDLVGPRTPSPVEESSFELPSAPQKKYKFKVQYDADSMCNLDDYSGEESSCAEPDWETSLSSRPDGLQESFRNHNSQVVDVATTPELEIDLNQAHEISKHIVTEIINQAVDILKKENHTNAQPISGQQFNLKREPESYSKISCHSARTAASAGNCSWINRARHALSRIMRNACLCTKTKDTQFHV